MCLFQVIYFQACELVLLSGHQKATYLYTLMFYNVVSYCSSYVKEVYERRNWSPYVTITERSQVKHLGMSATKLTLEWTKVNNIINLCIFISQWLKTTQKVSFSEMRMRAKRASEFRFLWKFCFTPFLMRHFYPFLWGHFYTF